MNKTVHKRLTAKTNYTHSILSGCAAEDLLFSAFSQEMQLLRDDARDLLQPRPQAIANILKMSRAN